MVVVVVVVVFKKYLGMKRVYITNCFVLSAMVKLQKVRDLTQRLKLATLFSST